MNLSHIESRPSKTQPGKEYDFFVDCDCSEDKMDTLMSKLREHVTSITVHSRAPLKNESEESNTIRIGTHTGLYWLLFCLLYAPWLIIDRLERCLRQLKST